MPKIKIYGGHDIAWANGPWEVHQESLDRYERAREEVYAADQELDQQTSGNWTRRRRYEVVGD